MLAGEFRGGRQLVLNGAEFVERALQLGRQELADDPVTASRVRPRLASSI
jgi:hypothetical protein